MIMHEEYKYIYTLQDLVFKKRELQFKCQCGVEFEFQDDMEVHQVYYVIDYV